MSIIRDNWETMAGVVGSSRPYSQLFYEYLGELGYTGPLPKRMKKSGIGLDNAFTLRAGGGWVARAQPAAFDYTVPFTVEKRGRVFRSNCDWESKLPAAGTTMYVSSAGNNANPGTEVSPKRSIGACYTAGAGTVIDLDGADYARTDGMEGITLARNFSIKSVSATKPVIGRFERFSALTWTQNGTYSNVWSCTRSTTVAVRDRSTPDANGDASLLVTRADIATVAANPGSQFITGSTVNVSLADGRQPDADVLVFMSGNNVQATASFEGYTLYLDNVEIWGGDRAFRCTGLTALSNFVFVDTDFRFSNSAEGCALDNFNEAYLIRCGGSANATDVLNYHATGLGQPFFYEEDCAGGPSGNTGGSNNFSTAHEDCRGVRVMTRALNCEGPQIVDVGTSQTWNLGCYAEGGAYNFRALESATMWLDTCEMADGDIDASNSATIYVADFIDGGGATTGNVLSYTP